MNAYRADPLMRNVVPQEYMSDVLWVLEPDIFPETHVPIRNAIRDRGHRLVEWSDAWWSDGMTFTLVMQR